MGDREEDGTRPHLGQPLLLPWLPARKEGGLSDGMGWDVRVG
jgi:hypothetical protein